MSDKRRYRKFTAKQKVELVLPSFRGDRSVAEICREHDLSETLLGCWRDQMVAAGAERLAMAKTVRWLPSSVGGPPSSSGRWARRPMS